MANPAFGSKDVEKLLNAAFETNDLQRICRAVDAAVLRSGSIIEIVRAAELDRVTLYRAFRLEKGPALNNMIKVLRVLGFRLVVEVRREVANSHERDVPIEGRSSVQKAGRCDCSSVHSGIQDGRNGLARQSFQRNLALARKCCGVCGKNDQDA